MSSPLFLAFFIVISFIFFASIVKPTKRHHLNISTKEYGKSLTQRPIFSDSKKYDYEKYDKWVIHSRHLDKINIKIQERNFDDSYPGVRAKILENKDRDMFILTRLSLSSLNECQEWLDKINDVNTNHYELSTSKHSKYCLYKKKND